MVRPEAGSSPLDYLFTKPLLIYRIITVVSHAARIPLIDYVDKPVDINGNIGILTIKTVV